MRRVFLTLLLSTAFVSVAAQTSSQQPVTSLDTKFQAGGKVRMNLTGGDYLVEPSSDNNIHIRWDMSEKEKLKKVRVTAEVHDKDAFIKTSGPHNVSFVIQIPERSGLNIRLLAGDLKVKQVLGD